jgi:putative ATP-dependent endonuclease of OLD family
MLKENSLELFNKIFITDYDKVDDLHKYMKRNKTECGMAIFNTLEKIKYPDYIMEAIHEK